jgi:hypothetical protein
MSGAIGYGRILQIRDDSASPPTYVTTGRLTAVNGPSLAADSIDDLAMDSPGRFREFVPGVRDPGELSGELAYTPGDAGMVLLIESLGTKAHFKITEPEFFGSPAPTFTSEGILTGFEITGPVADKMTASFTIKLSGQPTMTGVTFA